MEKYKVIELPSFKENPQVSNRELVAPSKGEVRVKVAYATVHPSDLMFLKGLYGLHVPKKFPLIPGFEGSGVIDAVGEEVSKELIGKHCTIGTSVTNPNSTFHGVWSQYFYCKPSGILIYDKPVNLSTACFAFANPLSGIGFLHVTRQLKAKAVVQNGAFSALGKIFLKLCIRENIDIINIVRKEEQVAELMKLGAKYVINSSDKDWGKDLRSLATKLNVTAFFDCVGGDMTNKTFGLMPRDTTLVHFGNLEVKKLNGFDSSEFIFYNKKIIGFWLNTWLASLNKEEKKNVMLELVKLVEHDSDLIKPSISAEATLDSFTKELNNYAKNMSSGKILLKPNF